MCQQIDRDLLKQVSPHRDVGDVEQNWDVEQDWEKIGWAEQGGDKVREEGGSGRGRCRITSSAC